MIDFIRQMFEAITIGSVLVSALAGVLIGAFYGFYLDPYRPPMFPWALLVAGWTFIGAFAAWSLLASAPFQLPFQVARGVLWAVTVGAIPIGRYGRHLLGH